MLEPAQASSCMADGLHCLAGKNSAKKYRYRIHHPQAYSTNPSWPHQNPWLPYYKPYSLATTNKGKAMLD